MSKDWDDKYGIVEDCLEVALPETDDVVALAQSGVPVLMRRAIQLAANTENLKHLVDVLTVLGRISHADEFGKGGSGGDTVDALRVVRDIINQIDGKSSSVPDVRDLPVIEHESSK